MGAISRSGYAIRVGNRLQALAKQALEVATPNTHLARITVLGLVQNGLAPMVDDLGVIRNSCREAKGMYASYPRLRRAILDAGDRVGELHDEARGIYESWRHRLQRDPYTDFTDLAQQLHVLGMNLKLVQFVPANDISQPLPEPDPVDKL